MWYIFQVQQLRGGYLHMAHFQDGLLNPHLAFGFGCVVHEVELWYALLQHQPHIHFIGHQPLLQQHVLVQTALEVVGPPLTIISHHLASPSFSWSSCFIICGQLSQQALLGLAPIADKGVQVGPVQVVVSAGRHQDVVHHEVHLSEQEVE